MLTTAELQTVIGQTAYGPDGDKLGKIGQVWVDDDSAEPEFVTVQTGLFGTHESFVPVKDATATGDSVQVPFTKEQVKNAPQCDADGGHITAEDGRRIYDYYGLPYAGAAAADGGKGTDTRTGNGTGTGNWAGNGTDTGTGTGDRTGDGTRGQDSSSFGTSDTWGAAGVNKPYGDPGDPLTSERSDTLRGDLPQSDPLASPPATGAPSAVPGEHRAAAADVPSSDTPLAPSTDDAMTLSAESISVGTEDHEVGRAKVRKFIETEHVTQSVPLRRERAVLEHEPITPDNMDRAMSGPELAEGEYEVILHEERPVIDKHVEPVERVRLTTTSETFEGTVEDDIRKERFELDGEIEDRNPLS